MARITVHYRVTGDDMITFTIASGRSVEQLLAEMKPIPVFLKYEIIDQEEEGEFLEE